MALPNKQSRIWSDTGTEPAAGEEPVEGGERYPAEWQNWILWALTADVDALFDESARLDAEKLDNTSYQPVTDVDATVDNAAASVAALDDVVAGLLPHDNSNHDKDYITASDVPDQRTQTRELQVETRTDDPSSPATGRVWIREDL